MSHEAMVTYRRDDGGEIGEAERWSTSAEHLVHEVWDEPVEFIEESWVRVGVRRFVLRPNEPGQHNPATCNRLLGACPECMVSFGMVGGVG